MRPDLKVIHFQSLAHPIHLLLTRSFQREAKSTFTDEELEGLLNYVAARPDVGLLMPGTNGLRKMRWKAKGSGKRGGARVIYYFRDLNMPLLLLAVYPKNTTVQLSVRRLAEISASVEQIVWGMAAVLNGDTEATA